MSRENVERMRQGYEAVNRALATGADLRPVMGGWDPEAVIDMGVLEGTFRGPGGFIEFLEGQAAVIEGLHCEPLEFFEAGDRIVVPIRLTGRARSNGLPFEYEGVHVWTHRDGKITHLRLYDTKDKALEAVGLRE